MIELTGNVINKCKKRYMTRVDANGKPIKNVANYGLEPGEEDAKIKGEYVGITIEAMEHIKPVLTNTRISNALSNYYNGKIQEAIKILHITDYINKYGIDIIQSVLLYWLNINSIDIPANIFNIEKPNLPDEVEKYVRRDNVSPINSQFRITHTGTGKTPIIPPDWNNRVFNNATDMHSKIDELYEGEGRPPVTYCIIYSMSIKGKHELHSIDKVNIKKDMVYGYVFLKGSIITSGIGNVGDKNYKLLEKSLEYVVIVSEYFCILFDSSVIGDNNKNSSKTSISVLVSRLQKCIRRGKATRLLLEETIDRLAIAPNYNVPEQQFMRVSAHRQMLWRMYISTVEDSDIYDSIPGTLGPLDIVLLAIISQHKPELRYNAKIVEMIKNTAVGVQMLPHNFKWRNGKSGVPQLSNLRFNTQCKSSWSNSFIIALHSMPMMHADTTMLVKAHSYLSTFDENITTLIIDKGHAERSAEYYECLCSSFDMHCYPNIILELQGSIFHMKNTEYLLTHQVPSVIWENISKLNIRENKKDIINLVNEQYNSEIIETLTDIQKYYNGIVEPDFVNIDTLYKNMKKRYYRQMSIVSPNIGRIAFLLLFGKSYPIRLNNKNAIIIICGDPKIPCKVKYSSEDKYLEEPEVTNAIETLIKMYGTYDIQIPMCVEGFNWNFSSQSVRLGITKGNDNTLNFMVNDITIPPFDARLILKEEKAPKTFVPSGELRNIIEECFYCSKLYSSLYLYELINICRGLDVRNFPTYPIDWVDIAYNSRLDPEFWMCVKSKLYNNSKYVEIGPIDRSGNKTHNSINYKYEGILLRVFLLFSVLYPQTVIFKNTNRFDLYKNGFWYRHLLDSVDNMIFKKASVPHISNSIKIKTVLWNHQKKASDTMFDQIINNGKLGLGDASVVGAGKTLSALTLCSMLYNYDNSNSTGFLILVPTTKLFKTWTDEVVKHTHGFEVVIQDCDGSVSNTIKSNTVLVTTLGRMRDHPIINRWCIVVIDECLSVQNRNALHTEEAWKQVLNSKYGVLMLSATFFRSRFDKLFYMLKMLRSSLPESKEYFDTILLEHIICAITEKKSYWKDTIIKYPLSNNEKVAYKQIVDRHMSDEKKYIALQKYIYDNINYVELFRKTLVSLPRRAKALIYSKSKNEAEVIANTCPNVGRYPDISKKHVVLSYAEGTYGLNDLITFNTILSRVPDSDKIPQMKGRLDRPGQAEHNLECVFILLENTIEEASLVNLQLANSFYKHHIMPLAEFYKVAIEFSTK